ncbi:Cytosolic seryl-tRNA synthetase [Beauveria asiatica]|uniref:serine--tRNA ligase n=1 Tax=Beauveria asiatica TaxID=1069075 RepID=A0AAW0S5E9_9HYPO
MPAPKQRKVAIVGSRSVGNQGEDPQSSGKPVTHVLSFMNRKLSSSNTGGADQGTESVPIVIVGNKSDLRPEQRQVSADDGKKLSEKLQCGWTEASARYNENVDRAFEILIEQIEKSQNPGEAPEKSNCLVILGSATSVSQRGRAEPHHGGVPHLPAALANNSRSFQPFLKLSKEKATANLPNTFHAITTEAVHYANMLDVNDFIVERGGNPERIRESQRRRFADEAVVDEVIALFEDHRKTQYNATQTSSKINEVQKLIGTKKKAKEDATDLLRQKIELEKEKKLTVESAVQKEKNLRTKIKTIGNIVDDSVPISNSEDNNAVQRTWAPEGVTVEKRNVLSHHDVLLRLDGYDPDRGVKVVGHRGYFLRQWGVFLNQALINYGLEFLSQRGYCPLQAPQFMLKDYMAKTAQLDDFDEQLYKVVDGDEANDKYLIATSEQPISAFHADEWLIAKDLPIKYAGYSTCYRREAGSHGRDAWGIYRVHQFEKVEQFVLTDPEKSWEAFEEMIGVSEEFYQTLGLPYQVIAIVSGALNNAAAKKLDLEAWFPHQGEYKELVSCSNCTDYQSRALDIRFGAKTQTDAKKKYVHCLNSTLCATTRTLCCVLENYQTDDGLRVPEPLRKYLPGAPEFIPFSRDLPKEAAGAKKTLPQREKK